MKGVAFGQCRQYQVTINFIIIDKKNRVGLSKMFLIKFYSAKMHKIICHICPKVSTTTVFSIDNTKIIKFLEQQISILE